MPSFFLLYFLEEARMAWLPPALLNIPMDPAAWALAGAVLGMGLGLFGFLAVSSRWRSEDARWYMAFLSSRRLGGTDYTKACRGLGLVLVALVVLAVPFGWNRYAQVREDGIAIHDALALAAREYRYADVASIRQAHLFVAGKGRTRRETVYVIGFRDGTVWSLQDWVGSPCAQRRLAALVSRKSGVPLTNADGSPLER